MVGSYSGLGRLLVITLASVSIFSSVGSITRQIGLWDGKTSFIAYMLLSVEGEGEDEEGEEEEVEETPHIKILRKKRPPTSPPPLSKS